MWGSVCMGSKSSEIHLSQIGKMFVDFLSEAGRALKTKPRCHSIDSFVQTYELSSPDEITLSTKTIYRYIHAGYSLLNLLTYPKWSVSENALRQRQRPTKEETRNLY